MKKIYQLIVLGILMSYAINVKAQTDSTDCPCEKGIPKMTVLYEGPDKANVLVFATKNQNDFVQKFTNVSTGTALNIDKSEFMKGSVKTKTYLMVEGQPSSEVTYHTSCSEYILGQTKGYFTVIAYLDAYGSGCASDMMLAGTINDNPCSEDRSGSINLEVLGGIPPYQFNWLDGDTTKNRQGLHSGTYTVIVEDATGLSDTASFTISNPGPLDVYADISYVGCGSNTKGIIAANVTGGSAPYTYSWNTGDTTRAISELPPDTYELTIVDTNGCTLSKSFRIEEKEQLQVSIAGNECNNGKLYALVTGGAPPYQYNWSGGQQTDTISVSSPGNFFLNVIDQNGCSASDTLEIESIARLELTYDIIPPTCQDSSSGSISIDIYGNTDPYDLLWSTGDTTSNLEGLRGGEYSLRVIDRRGEACSETYSFTVPEISKPEVYTSIVQISCAGNSNGEISIDSLSGGGSFDIVWDSGDTTRDLSELTSGSYRYTLTDSLGCTTSQTIVINEPDTLTAAITFDFCSSEYLTANISGGTAPYYYYWNDISTGSRIIPDSSGTYPLEVVDSKGCSDTTSVTIDDIFAPLNISANKWDASCDSPTGQIELEIIGGTKPYDITWDDGDSALTKQDLKPGYYQVTVTDANNCEKSRRFFIQAAESLTATVDTVQPDCDGTGGAVFVSVTNGQAPYQYSWSTGDTTAIIENLDSGMFTLKVTDQGGCSFTETYTLSRPADCLDDGTGTVDSTSTTSCCDGKVEWLTLQNTGNSTEDVQIYQKLDQQVLFSGSIMPGEQFTFYGKDRKNTMGPEIILTTATTSYQVHTSCSEPIGPGLTIGNFEVIAGGSRNGGDLCPIDAASQSIETAFKFNYEVHPNPTASGAINLLTEGVDPDQKELEIRIYNLSGMLKYETQVAADENINKLQLNLTDGHYILQVRSGLIVKTKRLIIRK